MGIFFVFELIKFIVYVFILFLVLSSVSNIYINITKMVIFSVINGVVLSILSLFTLPVLGEMLIVMSMLSSTIIVLYYPIRISKFMILELIIFAYIMLLWGLSYILQLLIFTLFYVTKISYSLFLLCRSLMIVFVGVVVSICFVLIYKKKEIEKFVYDVEMFIFNKKINLKMFLDSGNMLYDKVSGLPVVIISQDVVKNLKHEFNICNCRTIQYNSVGEDILKLPILGVGKIRFGKGSNEDKVSIGVVEKRFCKYDGLLHPKLC